MTRVASCPKCNAEYELDEDDVGHLTECDCGSALFACHTQSIDSFSMFCKNCGGQHQVRGSDAAQNVRVACGANVCVPTVLLRAPVGNRNLAAKADAYFQQRKKSVAQSRSKTELAAVDKASPKTPPVEDPALTLGDELGAVLVKRESTEENGSTDSKRADGGKAKQRALPKRNIGSTVGVLGVATLLVVSVVMFFLREPPSRKAKSQSGNATQPRYSNGNQPEFQRNMVIAGDGLDSDTQYLGMDGQWLDLPATTQPTAVAAGGNSGEVGADGDYRLPPPTVYALPARKQARDLIPIKREKTSFASMQSAVEVAFEEYGKVQKRKEKADLSNNQADVKAYQQAVGRTIGIIEQVHELAVAKSAKDETATTRYLLAFLYFKAGMLAEAAVMGEAVARWGNEADTATKEGGMIALAATQELSDLHWGDAEDLGEVRQMEVVAEILQRRWPDDQQNALIWLNVAYLYEAFNHPQEAIRIYGNIPESSDHHGTAMVAGGMAEWSVLRQQQVETGTAIAMDDRKRVRQLLAKGLREIERDQTELSVANLEARLALSQIDLIGGDFEKAEQWLTKNPPSVLSSIRVRENDENETAMLVDETVVKQLFDVLFHARQQQGDTNGATQAIENLAALLGASGEQVAARRLSILKVTFERLKTAGELTESDFDAAEGISSKIMKDAVTVPTTTLLWLAESWALVGEHAKDGKIAKESARIAAEIFGDAIKRDDFPPQSLQAAQLRRIELLRRSGEVMQSLKQIEDMLADEPNVFTLQIAAAVSLQQVAVEFERPSDLLAAIEGPSGFSPIWGWGKLVTNLHASLYSAGRTPRHAEQFALAQYHLFWCRFQLAVQIKDAGGKMRQTTEIEQALSKRLVTMDKKSDWYARYQALHAQMVKGN